MTRIVKPNVRAYISAAAAIRELPGTTNLTPQKVEKLILEALERSSGFSYSGRYFQPSVREWAYEHVRQFRRAFGYLEIYSDTEYTTDGPKKIRIPKSVRLSRNKLVANALIQMVELCQASAKA